MDKILDCEFHRKFGVELEVNTTSGIVKIVDWDHGEIPEGADTVALAINRATKQPVYIERWDHSHNNKHWIVKSDSSCGIEICTPVLCGWRGLRELMEVIDEMKRSNIKVDSRCSMHVHVSIGDLTKHQLASVIAYYVKCEHVFFDAMPMHRKSNRYCQLIGMSDIFRHDYMPEPMEIVNAVGVSKYLSLNCYHFLKGGGFTSSNSRKATIEFRIADCEACVDSYFAKNWIRLLLHFIECTKDLPLPPPYEKGDQQSGLLWLDPSNVFKLLHFDDVNNLSPGLMQVRSWFIERIVVYGFDYDDLVAPVLWSGKGRSVARDNFYSMGVEWDWIEYAVEESRYGNKYVK